MEISPAKSSGVVSDSEGEDDRVRTDGLMDIFPHDPNAAIPSVSTSRDWHHHISPATMASHNPSSECPDWYSCLLELTISRLYLSVSHPNAWATTRAVGGEFGDPDQLGQFRHQTSPTPSHAAGTPARRAKSLFYCRILYSSVYGGATTDRHRLVVR